jgi:hypothetical protein
MQTRRFGKRMGLVVAMTAMLAAPAVVAQQAEPAKAAMRVRGGKKGKRVATYELTSEPRRLPPPNGLCGLETGPETFQIVTNNESQVAQLKNFIGKEVSVKVDEVACAQEAGQLTDAVVTKWSVVTKH